MNIKQAKELDLHIIVEAAGGEAVRSRSTENSYFFKSCLPGRDEKTASLHVWKAPNGTWCWKDHGGQSKGGDIIKFAQEMTGGTVSDALKWLDQFSDIQAAYKIQNKEQTFKSEKRDIAPDRHKYQYSIEKRKHLFEKPYNKNLLAFINSRNVSAKIIANYASEIHFADERKKKLFGLGWNNESLGIEVRTALDGFPKCVIGTKDISVINSPGLSKKTVHLFEGMFDFFTWLELLGQHHAKHPPYPAIVLNSASMAARAAELLNTDPRFAETTHIILWPQTDKPGQDAVVAFGDHIDHDRFSFGTMDHIYEGFKDLNEYWSSTPEASRTAIGARFRNVPPVQKIFDTSASADARRLHDLRRKPV